MVYLSLFTIKLSGILPFEKTAVRRRSGTISSFAASCIVGFSNLFSASDFGRIVTSSEHETSEAVDSL